MAKLIRKLPISASFLAFVYMKWLHPWKIILP